MVISDNRLFVLGGEELTYIDLSNDHYHAAVACKGANTGLAVTGGLVYILLESGGINIFNTNLEHQKVLPLPYEASSLGASADHLFVGDMQGVLHMLSHDGTEVHKFSMWGTRITSVSVAEECGWVVAGDTTGKVKLWNYGTKEVIILYIQPPKRSYSERSGYSILRS
jgi:hypothetical protein